MGISNDKFATKPMRHRTKNNFYLKKTEFFEEISKLILKKKERKIKLNTVKEQVN